VNLLIISWIVSLLLGTLLFVLGVVLFFIKKKNKTNTLFSLLFEFAAYCILLYPTIFQAVPQSRTKGIESFFLSLLNTITQYMGNGYNRFENAEQLSPEFYSVYCILMVIVNILMLAFAADFILHLIDGPYQLLRVKMHAKKPIYLFSECNNKTLALAKSIYNSDYDVAKINRCLIVFLFYDKQDILPYTNELDSIEAVTINISIESLFKSLNGKSEKIEIYLFNNSEILNLKQMGDVCGIGDICSDTSVFVEVNRTHWSLYDDYIKSVTASEKRLTVNLVRTEENFVYNLLLEKSIFDNTLSYDGAHLINILIVGYNDRCIEFLKAVLHLGQMPGYELCVTLVEQEDHKNIIRHLFPELKERGDGYGDSIYSFNHVTKLEYNSSDFDDFINTVHREYTYIFVNTEDDLANIDIGVNINRLCLRAGRTHTRYVLVNLSDKNLLCDSKLNIDLTRDIDFVGDIESVYDYQFIKMSNIEKATQKIHDIRQTEKALINKEHIRQPWKDYCNNEYNRHSVYARTLSFAYKVKIIGENSSGSESGDIYSVTSTSNEWKVYEHMRWNMYMRTLGYVKAPEVLLNEDRTVDRGVRKVAHIHPCLVPYDNLSSEEQEKDSLKLTPEVVKVLKDLFQ